MDKDTDSLEMLTGELTSELDCSSSSPDSRLVVISDDVTDDVNRWMVV